MRTFTSLIVCALRRTIKFLCGEASASRREHRSSHTVGFNATPPVRFPNVYGIDMPTRTELLASRHDQGAGPVMEDIAKDIGADRIVRRPVGRGAGPR